MARTDAARWLLHHLKEKGYTRQLADWLGSSLKATGGASPEERTWLFDVEGASALYDAYRSVHLCLALNLGCRVCALIWACLQMGWDTAFVDV